MTRVIDTSVVVAWYVDEAGSTQARRYVGQQLTAPALLWPELANALWSKARKGQVTLPQAISAVEDAQSTITQWRGASYATRALSIANELGHPVYDCVYLALAEALSTTLVTADRRLARACGGTGYERLIELAHA